VKSFAWLPEALFLQNGHKSYVVNLKQVDTIEAHQVKIDKTAIPLAPVTGTVFIAHPEKESDKQRCKNTRNRVTYSFLSAVVGLEEAALKKAS